MFIWLPPSEGKTEPQSGAPLVPSAFSLPALSPARAIAADALIATCRRDDAAQILGLGAKSAGDVAVNARLASSPCAPAARVFSGVLYDAAGLSALKGEAAAWAHEHVHIFSGLFGVMSPADPIPNHRLGMNVDLPGIGRMSAFWRPHLDEALREVVGSAPVLDMRSGPYQAACPAPWATLIKINAVKETAGRRTTVSHDAKKWRGLLTAELLRGRAGSFDHSGVLRAVESCCERIRFTDASGVEHRVIGMETSDPRAKKGGGLEQAVTLVTT